MAQATYPVPGYRTPQARAHQMAAGFQSLPSRLTPANDNTPPWVGRPANDNVKPTRNARLFKVGGRLVSAAVARHPAVRAARAVWEVQHFLHDPRTAQQAATIALNGWTHCWHCAGSPPTHYQSWTTAGCWLSGCKNAQAMTVQPMSVTAPGGHNSIVWVYPHPTFANRWNQTDMFSKNPGAGRPAYVPGMLPLPVPSPVPMPLPWAVLPYQANGPHREAGYSDQPGRATTPAQAGSPRHRPPGRGTKERKITLMSGGALRNLIEQAFEATEWVGIAHASLPADCKAGKYATMAEKFAAVYACAGRLNMCKLIEGVVNNYIEDKVIGTLGQASGAAGRSIGKASGGLGYTRPAFRKSNLWIPKINFGC